MRACLVNGVAMGVEGNVIALQVSSSVDKSRLARCLDEHYLDSISQVAFIHFVTLKPAPIWYMYMSIDACTRGYIGMYVFMCLFTRTYICLCMRTRVYINKYVHFFMYVYSNMFMFVYICIYIKCVLLYTLYVY